MQTEGPLYWAVMALHVYDHDSWKQVRVSLLKRIMVLAQARHSSPGGATRSDSGFYARPDVDIIFLSCGFFFLSSFYLFFLA